MSDKEDFLKQDTALTALNEFAAENFNNASKVQQDTALTETANHIETIQEISPAEKSDVFDHIDKVKQEVKLDTPGF